MSWSSIMKLHDKTIENKNEGVSYNDDLSHYDENTLKVLRYDSDLRKRADRELEPRSYRRALQRIGEF
jgi:hypothetical protein